MPGRRIVAIAAAAAAVIAAGVAIAVSHKSPSQSADAVAGSTGGQVAAGPIQLASITPASHTKGVDGAAPIIVTFSAPMSTKSPDPTLRPAVPGTWTTNGHSLMFTPSAAFSQSTKITVSVPAGPTACGPPLAACSPPR